MQYDEKWVLDPHSPLSTVVSQSLAAPRISLVHCASLHHVTCAYRAVPTFFMPASSNHLLDELAERSDFYWLVLIASHKGKKSNFLDITGLINEGERWTWLFSS